MWGRIGGLEHGRKGDKGVGEAGEKCTEAKEIVGNYRTMLNITQSKNS